MVMQAWKIDEAHSGIHFTVSHLVVAKVRGRFTRWSAELLMDEEDVSRSSVAVTIEAASLETGHPKRDADLRSPMFFDAERFPLLQFRSRRVEPAGKHGLRVTGELTIRDVTREVVLDVAHGGYIDDPWGGRRVGYTASASIQRGDFGMAWNQVLEAGGVFIGDRVDIGIDVEAVGARGQAAAA